LNLTRWIEFDFDEIPQLLTQCITIHDFYISIRASLEHWDFFESESICKYYSIQDYFSNSNLVQAQRGNVFSVLLYLLACSLKADMDACIPFVVIHKIRPKRPSYFLRCALFYSILLFRGFRLLKFPPWNLLKLDPYILLCYS
jgi:hypothetical protein